MRKAIRQLFADATAKLEDLHAIAIEGQRADNAPEMQSALAVHLQCGIGALNKAVRDIAKALERSGS